MEANSQAANSQADNSQVANSKPLSGTKYLENVIPTPGIQKKIFTLRGCNVPNCPYFYLDDLSEPAYKNSKIIEKTTLLRDYELSDDGIYTWIIGTKMNLRNLNQQEKLNSCDPEKLYIWLIRSVSEQEIGSKHYDIMLKMQNRLEKFKNNAITIEEREMIKRDGIIDELFFAARNWLGRSSGRIFLRQLPMACSGSLPLASSRSSRAPAARHLGRRPPRCAAGGRGGRATALSGRSRRCEPV